MLFCGLGGVLASAGCVLKGGVGALLEYAVILYIAVQLISVSATGCVVLLHINNTVMMQLVCFLSGPTHRASVDLGHEDFDTHPTFVLSSVAKADK